MRGSHDTSPRFRNQRGGFTLVELLIYVGIFAIAAGLMTGVLTTLTRVEVRENASVEVSTQAQFVIQRVQQLIRDSSTVELTKDTPTSLLKLRMPTVATDPTCVQLSNGTVYLMQGNDGVNKQTCLATSTAQAKTLTDAKVIVNTLTFTRFSNPPAKDTTQVNLTVTYNSTNPQESIISRTLQTAITKVSAAVFDSDIVPASDNTYNVGIGAQRWLNGLFSNSLLVGYTSVTGGVAAFNGNVGMSTSTPSYPLDVYGGFRVGNSSSTNTLVVNNGTNNIGIGTASPAQKLEVAQNNAIKLGNAYLSSGGAAFAHLASNAWYNGTWQIPDGTRKSALWQFQDDAAYLYQTQTAGASDWAIGMSVIAGGKVGIGTATPSSKLQVAGGDVGLGNATATGNQPITVWLTNASGAIRSAGEIVIVSAGNAFTTTVTANSRLVLGVVYDTTIAIGAVGRIAIGGVVSVTSVGATTSGDYLVTSTTGGKAGDATVLASGESALGRWLETSAVAGTFRALIRY